MNNAALRGVVHFNDLFLVDASLFFAHIESMPRNILNNFMR